MPEFTRRWKYFSTEEGRTPLTELTEPPSVSSVSSFQGTSSDILCSHPAMDSPAGDGGQRNMSQADAFSDHLLSRLRAGSDWLAVHHVAWLRNSPHAADDERFSVALAAWSEMERSLRLVWGYEGCILGPDRSCPPESPVTCDSCVISNSNPTEQRGRDDTETTPRHQNIER